MQTSTVAARVPSSDTDICKSAAYLVAALHTAGVVENLKGEARDSFYVLREELDGAGYMDHYKTA